LGKSFLGNFYPNFDVLATTFEPQTLETNERLKRLGF